MFGTTQEVSFDAYFQTCALLINTKVCGFERRPFFRKCEVLTTAGIDKPIQSSSFHTK